MQSLERGVAKCAQAAPCLTPEDFDNIDIVSDTTVPNFANLELFGYHLHRDFTGGWLPQHDSHLGKVFASLSGAL